MVFGTFPVPGKGTVVLLENVLESYPHMEYPHESVTISQVSRCEHNFIKISTSDGNRNNELIMSNCNVHWLVL